VHFLYQPIQFFFEFFVEMTYPLPEATSASIYTAWSNVINLGFIFAVDYLTPTWINWFTTGLFALFAFLLLFFKENYKRLDTDNRKDIIQINQ